MKAWVSLKPVLYIIDAILYYCHYLYKFSSSLFSNIFIDICLPVVKVQLKSGCRSFVGVQVVCEIWCDILELEKFQQANLHHFPVLPCWIAPVVRICTDNQAFSFLNCYYGNKVTAYQSMWSLRVLSYGCDLMQVFKVSHPDRPESSHSSIG